jgi:hypothetical protein
MAKNGNLSARQQRAILALLTAANIREAARAVEVGERTLHTWLKEPMFAAAYRTARAEAVSQAVARLQQGSAEAVDTLTTIMKDPEAPPPARVQAAVKVLEMSIKATELAELQRRIAELEHAQDVPEPEAEEEPIVSNA